VLLGDEGSLRVMDVVMTDDLHVREGDIDMVDLPTWVDIPSALLCFRLHALRLDQF